MVKCRLVEKDSYPKEIGDMWFEPEYTPEELSEQYFSTWKDIRAPIMVVLPDKSRFCVDSRYSTSRKAGTHAGWVVTGEIPNISCSPSIHIIVSMPPDGHDETVWHGYLTNGELV